jgi:hypothetical protein
VVNHESAPTLFDHHQTDARTPAPASGRRRLTVVSWGLGVDSTAYLIEVLSDLDRYGVDPSRMIVLHAVVGSEWTSTIADAERHVLPLLADAGVRTVQVARRSRRDADGIEILSDTTRPRRVHRTGPWTLEDDCHVSGTVPQLSHRRCSLRFKGWPLSQWQATNLPTMPYAHVIGYNAEETRRAARDLTYTTATRTPVHPLIDWGWTRAACAARLLREFGIVWQKSACRYCPYAGGKSLAATLARMRAHPAEAATALLLEAPAIALNPNSLLYGTHSLRQRLLDDGNTVAVALADQQLHAQPWSVYHVRRLHFPAAGQPTRKGISWRSVTPLFTGTATTVRDWLTTAIGQPGNHATDADGRIWLRRPDPRAPFPHAESFLVATVAGIEPKARPAFAERWARICGQDPLFHLS